MPKHEKQPANHPNLTLFAAKHFATAKQLRERYGGRSELWLERIMKNDPAFPRPIYIGRFRFWDLDKIEAYERHCAARRAPAEAE